jgi:hypothetical protein
MRLLSPLRGVAVILALIAVAAICTLLSGSSDDAEGADGYRPPKVDQSRLLLRLGDLPSGYGNGYLGEGRGSDGILCEAFTRSSDEPDPIAGFARMFRAKGCIAAYVSRFAIPGQKPGAPVIFSGVIALGSAAAAADAWDLAPTMLGRLLPGGPPREVKTSAKVGAQTRLFHTAQARYPFLIRGEQKASFLVWRSGKTVAALVAMGAPFADNDRVAAELASLQQAHIRKPTPYTGAERSDAEVGLDDPAIDIPVYWLGRTFRPGSDLPPNRLFQSGFSGEALPEEPLGMGSGEAPQPPLAIDYNNIWLDTWTPETWHVFADSRTAKVITSWKCTLTRTVMIPGGSATIFGGYKENFPRCPKKAPSAFTAWVDVGGVKIVVNSPPAPDFIETVNPYGSFAGMEAIVRGLRLRGKPVY